MVIRGQRLHQIGIHRASRSDVGWRDARAWITLMAPALWAGKGSGRADRGKKVLGYGSGLAAAGSCSVLAGNIGSAPASRSGTAG